MRPFVVLLVALAVALGGCAAASRTEPEPPGTLRVQVLQTLPHDTGAFTEGLELDGGTLYESTGLEGQSSLRAGPLGQPPTVRADLPSSLFGEGITVAGSSVWQLTWQNNVAIERDARTLAERQRVGYSGEGWGLCYQQGAGRLVMSDGTDRLTFRDPRTFAQQGQVQVRDGDRQVSNLNELECVGNQVYANVWKTNEILRIDPTSGAVTAHIDASGLLSPGEAGQADVLNGIAAIPGTDGEFLLTGKLWPKMFRVRFGT